MKLTQTLRPTLSQEQLEGLFQPRPTLSQEQLEGLFQELCNKSNWKEEITALIDASKFADYNNACIHFTGGPLDIIDSGGGRALVHSKGYYHFIGA